MRYTNLILTTLVFFLISAGISFANNSPKEIIALIFAATDKNKDGYFTLEEAQKADKTITKEQFQIIDTDGDQRVSYEEYRDFSDQITP